MRTADEKTWYMINVYCRDQKELQIQKLDHEITEVFSDCIKEKMMRHPGSVVYVIDNNNCLVGIITLGTVCKNITDSSKWINKVFRFLYEGKYEKIQVQSILENNQQISNIPIVNRKNEIIRECVRKQEFQLKVCLEQFRAFYQCKDSILSLTEWLYYRGYRRLNLMNYEKS